MFVLTSGLYYNNKKLGSPNPEGASTGLRDVFNHSNFNWPRKAGFATDLRAALMREMNWRYLSAANLDLLAHSLVDSVLEIEILEGKFRDTVVAIPSSQEIIAFNLKKKFTLTLREIEGIVWGERERYDRIVTTLVSKPEWLSPEDTVEILEDLRCSVTMFFTAFDFMRTTGHRYLFASRFMQDFPRHNIILSHSAEVKVAFARWSLELKKGLPFLCRLLKEIRRRWTWFNVEEKEIVLERLRLAHEEKVKVRDERKEARLKHNRMIRKAKLARREAYKNKVFS